ncbi:MAG TPA: TerB family tellurite resistance protein [Polyangiaceae bacterium]|nr:TerB family tellurite resistance protein [Polyangiaceae bacterium]
MFGSWLKTELAVPDDAREIAVRVREHLPAADPETVRVVAALAGLLAAVAYADRDYSNAEEALVREVLGRVNGMTRAGIDAVCGAMRRHVVEASTVQIPHFAREIRELGDAELRREVLDALVDLAAADGDIATSETNLLRQIATSLGLTQADYNDSQARYRERLASLKR